MCCSDQFPGGTVALFLEAQSLREKGREHFVIRRKSFPCATGCRPMRRKSWVCRKSLFLIVCWSQSPRDHVEYRSSGLAPSNSVLGRPEHIYKILFSFFFFFIEPLF